MTTKLALALSIALAGCFVVPTTKTTARNAGTETALIQGAARGLDVDAKATPTDITVRATFKRECERQTLAVTELTSTKHARYSPPQDPRAGIFGAVLAPITLPISAIVTGIAVATSSAKTKQTRKLIHADKLVCVGAAANLPVTIALPSGQVIERTTDSAGELAVTIPPTEPYVGEVAVHAGSETRRVDYHRAMPAVTALREATRTCAVRYGVAGPIKLEIDVDSTGAPSGIRTDTPDGDLAACVTIAITSVRFPEAHRDARLVLRYQPGS